MEFEACKKCPHAPDPESKVCIKCGIPLRGFEKLKKTPKNRKEKEKELSDLFG